SCPTCLEVTKTQGNRDARFAARPCQRSTPKELLSTRSLVVAELGKVLLHLIKILYVICRIGQSHGKEGGKHLLRLIDLLGVILVFSIQSEAGFLIIGRDPFHAIFQRVNGVLQAFHKILHLVSALLEFGKGSL